MRTRTWQVLVLIALTLGLARAQTLDVWIYESLYGDDVPLVQAAEAFMAENPGIQINFVPTQFGSSSYLDKYVVAALAGGGPDALMVDIAWSPQLAAMGTALALDEFIGDAIDDFFAGPVTTVTFEGETFGLPFYTNSLGMFYNRTAFEAAGLPLPAEGWTWDDFMTAVDTLSDGSMYGFGLLGGWGGTYEFYTWAWQNGGDFLTADYAEPAFNSPETLEAAEFFLDLVTNPRYVPEGVKTWRGWDELGAAFANGVVAMFQSGDWALRTVSMMEPDFEWGVAPLPRNVESASLVGGANWIVNPNTRHTEAALQWIEYVTGPAAFEMMDGYNRVAARRGAEAAQSIVRDDPRMQVFVEQLDIARARPPIPEWTPIDWDCLQPAFLRVILEDADVRRVMAEAELCAIGKLRE